MDLQTIVTAVMSAITGGSLLKFLEFWLSRSKQKSEADQSIRKELREEMDRLRNEVEMYKKELRIAEEEMDQWKIKYWNIYTNYTQFKLTVFGILLQNGIRPEDVLPQGKEDGPSA